jgi:hypothetical protein
MLRAHAFSVAAVICAGCTFSGLADFDVKQCHDTGGNELLDDCLSLYPKDQQAEILASSCLLYQCDLGTFHCVEVPPDFDHDSQIASRCGGTDCDDNNATVGTGDNEICDPAGAPALDNNCNGLIDEGLLKTSLGFNPENTSPLEATVASSDGHGLAAYLIQGSPGSTATCIQVANDMTPPIGNTCTFLGQAGDGIVARQPMAKTVGAGTGVVFAQTAPCNDVVFQTTTGGTTSVGCGTKASAPSFEPSSDGLSAVLAFYDAAPSPRSILPECASPPTALEVRWMNGPSTASPTIVDQAVLTSKSSNVSPAALVALSGTSDGAVKLAAAPDGDGVTVWALLPPMPTSATVVPLTSIGQPNVVSVAMAVDRGGDRVALVLLYCVEQASTGTATQSLVFAMADIRTDFGRVIPTLSNVTTTSIATGISVVGAPSISWVSSVAYNEWRVAYATWDGERHIQRVTTEGVPIGEAIDHVRFLIDAAPIAIGALPSGDVMMVDATGPNGPGGPTMLGLVCKM